MKAYKPYKQERDISTPKTIKKPKELKPWVKEYQWKTEKDFNSFPKWFNKSKVFSDDWFIHSWGKYKTVKAIEDSLKADVRSWDGKWVKGRNWRGRNTITGEIIPFPDIENYYKI